MRNLTFQVKQRKLTNWTTRKEKTQLMKRYKINKLRKKLSFSPVTWQPCSCHGASMIMI